MFFMLCVVAEIAILILVGAALILSNALPNKVCRFVFLFVLGVSLNFVVNHLRVWSVVRNNRMGWTAAVIIALLFAAFGTFWSPQPHKSDAR
jgi:hypothetical protein